MRGTLALLVLLAGCDALFNIDLVPGAPDASGGADGTPGGAITFVQQTSDIAASAPAMTIAFGTNQHPGDLNVIFAGWTTGPGVASVTDSAGNTYQPAMPEQAQNGLGQATYFATNIAGGPTSVTVTFNGSTNDIDVRMLEYAGLAHVDALDAAISTFGVGTQMQSAGLITTRPHTLLAVGAMVAASVTDAGPGYRLRVVSASGNGAEDREVSMAAAYTATAVQSGDQAYILQVAAFAAE